MPTHALARSRFRFLDGDFVRRTVYGTGDAGGRAGLVAR